MQGRCLEEVLERWLAHPYWHRRPPKSLAPAPFVEEFVAHCVETDPGTALAFTFTKPDPTLIVGTFEVAAFSARSPISASTIPVISATAATPEPAMMPTLIGFEVARTV